jgi:hypothetical protein
MFTNRGLLAGVQDFEKLRTRGNVYVDKTSHIHQLLCSDAPCFLSRPRRFRYINFDVPKLENEVTIAPQAVMDYRMENPDSVPALYQSGYLTISGKQSFKIGAAFNAEEHRLSRFLYSHSDGRQ